MRQSVTSRIVLYILALLVLIYSLFPIYWMVISALRGPKEFFEKSTVLLPTNFNLEFFYNLIQSTNYLVYYKNSFIVAAVATVITVITATMIAYVTTRFKFFGFKVLMNAMLVAYMLPPMLIAIPLLGVFIFLGIDDTLFALTIAHISITLPFGVWMLDGFFRTIPYELEESAMVDGASRIVTLVRIILPLITPGVITVAIFSFIVSWVDYTFGLMIVSSEMNKTVPVGLASIKGAYDLQWGELLAGAALIAVPMMFVFAFVTKYFIKGLTAGAVKG